MSKVGVRLNRHVGDSSRIVSRAGPGWRLAGVRDTRLRSETAKLAAWSEGNPPSAFFLPTIFFALFFLREVDGVQVVLLGGQRK